MESYDFDVIGEDNMEFTHTVEAHSEAEAWKLAKADYPDAKYLNLQSK